MSDDEPNDDPNATLPPLAAAGPPPPRDTGAGLWRRRVLGNRTPDDRYVAGLLGGLGRRFDIDPLFLRVGVAVAAWAVRFDAPLLVPAVYAFGWIVVPETGRRSLLATLRQRASLQEAGAAVLLAVLATMVAASDSLWFAGVLALAAWALLARAGDPPNEPAAGPLTVTDTATTTTSASASASASDAELSATGGAPAGPSAVAATWGRARRGVAAPRLPFPVARRLRTRRHRSPALWPLALAMLVAASIVFVTADSTADPGVDPAVLVNVALIIIGLVVALGAWRGRAGITPLLALPLLPLWLAFSAADVGRFSGSGSSYGVVSSFPSDGVVEREIGYGSIDLDVEPEAVPAGEVLRITTRVTAGTTTIVVPGEAALVVHNKVGLGGTDIDGLSFVRSATHHLDPIENVCEPDVIAGDLEWLYGEWAIPIREAEAGDDDLDPATAAEIEAAGLPLPEPAGALHGDEAWMVDTDRWGNLCLVDQEPIELGMIEIDAVVGLGGLNIVRRY